MGSSRPLGAEMLHLTLTYEARGLLNQCLIPASTCQEEKIPSTCILVHM